MNVVLVGCGRWGANIVRDLRQLGCEVTVVARSQRTRDNARRAGATSIVAALDEAKSAAGIVVATPSVTHAAVLEECLRTGAPVYCEKPLTTDAESAARLADVGAGRLFVMEKWRYHPAIEALAAIARSGELGAPRGLRVVRTQWGCNHTDADASWTLLPHDLSVVREILGGIPPLESVSGHHEGGWATHIYAAFGPVPWALIESGVQHPGDRREVQLFCDNGTAIMADPYEKHVSIYRATEYVQRRVPEPERRPISTEFPLLRELRAFVEHLRGGPPPKAAARESAEHVALIADIRARLGMTRATA